MSHDTPWRSRRFSFVTIGILAVLALIASFLLVAPVIESGTSGSTQLFQAIGTAEGGAG